MTKHAIFWKWEKHSCVVVVPWNPWALNWYAKFKIVLNILHAHSRSISWKKVEKKEKESITEKRRDRIVYICWYTVAERRAIECEEKFVIEWLISHHIFQSTNCQIGIHCFTHKHTHAHCYSVHFHSRNVILTYLTCFQYTIRFSYLPDDAKKRIKFPQNEDKTIYIHSYSIFSLHPEINSTVV